ncbi:unnamed protein product [Brachionus calyciflorus]|uniref:Uncharacterized protein n=1 Tax=Brachionus calyciflorus TaxID=104777 RepID=A0A814PIK4_9BILA|nr:unnamed protein product [Brachionus calyciflorus]
MVSEWNEASFFTQELNSTNLKISPDSGQFMSQNSLCSSICSLVSTNQTNESLYYDKSETHKHKFDLDIKEYDIIKQNLLEYSLPTEFKILNLIPDEEAQNVLGSWNFRNDKIQKVSPNKPLASRPTFSYSFSSNITYQFRNFNDWRSHLIYYKQKKNGHNNLPNLTKEIKPTAIIPTVVSKQVENEEIPQRKCSITRSKTLHILKRDNTLFKSTKIFENENVDEPILVKSLSRKQINTQITKSSTNESFFNFSAPASITNGSVHKKNIDFKMEVSKIKANETPNQKFIPYLKGKRAGGGVLKVSTELEKNKIQLEQIPQNLVKKYICHKSKSFSSGLTGLLHSQQQDSSDDTYYTITSIGTNDKKLNKKYVPFYQEEEEHENFLKSVPSRADNMSILGSQHKKSPNQSEINNKNDKLQIGQPSLSQFIQNSNLTNQKKSAANVKNFKQIANRIKRQHREMLKQHKASVENQMENGQTIVSELKGVSMTDTKNIINPQIRFEVAN